jgi:hypothetical protein
MSLRDSILAATTLAPVQVTVPGIAEPVYVAVNSAFSSAQARKDLEECGKDDGRNAGRTLATILCDAEGKLLFDVRNDDDALALSKLGNATISAILAAATKANSAPEPGKA